MALTQNRSIFRLVVTLAHHRIQIVCSLETTHLFQILAEVLVRHRNYTAIRLVMATACFSNSLHISYPH